jgi:hypothetical protein
MSKGICRGGPYDGQTLDFPTRDYVVATHFHPPLTLKPSEPNDELPEIKFGSYRFALGVWHWRDNAEYPWRDQGPRDVDEGSR